MELTLEDIFMMLKKRWWLIVSFVVIGMAASGVYTVLTYTPVYSTYTTILVNRYDSMNGMISSNDYSLNNDLISTFQGVINSNSSKEKIAEQLGFQNLGSISISSVANSIIKISVTHANGDMAVQVANTTAKVFQEMIKEMMYDLDSSILDEAQSSYISNGMNLSKKVMIGAILGGMISVGICFIREYLNKTFKSQKEVTRVLDVPVIGIIPDICIK